MNKAIWLSYDLGVKGDYEGLYAWLDDHGAIECGENVAFLRFELRNEENLAEELKENLSKNINFSKKDRIYIIWEIERRIKGKFILGKRKSSPWVGFGSVETEEEEEEEA